MADRGIFEQFGDNITSPLFLGGAALLTGEGFGGMQQGMQTGQQFVMQRQRQAQQAQRQKAFDDIFTNGEFQKMLPQGMPALARAAGPDAGIEMLAKAYQSMNAANKPTDDQREYNMAVLQGFKGSFMDYMSRVKSFGAPRTNINMQQETAYDKTLGEGLAKEFIKLNETSATAHRDSASLSTMKQVLADPNLYTGTGGATVQALKKGAETLFGIPVRGTQSGEIMQNLGNEIAVGNREKLPGPMSNADREFLIEMAPGLSKTPEGNRLLIELGMEHKNWQIERARVARAYATKNRGRLDAGFYGVTGDLDNLYTQKFSTIMNRLKSMGQLAPRPPTVGVPNIGVIEGGYRFRGGNPSQPENWEPVR